MPYYETVFMARQDLTDGQVKDLTDQFSKIITDNDGKVTKTENWGLRTLAYRINKSRKAHYVLLESDAPSEAIIELERLLRLNEDVVRSLTTRLDALTDGPSVMMEKPKEYDKDGKKPYDKKPYNKKDAA